MGTVDPDWEAADSGPAVPPGMGRRRLARARGQPAPARFRAPLARKPIVVWASWAWRPGLLLGWLQDADGWSCHIRYRVGREDIDQFVVYDPILILPVVIEDGTDWWLPPIDTGRQS
jgi:hypothetical protein